MSDPFRETYSFGQPIRRFLYKPIDAVKGGGCHAEIHLPPTSVARPPTGFPVVIVIHGGAWVTSGLRQLPAQQVDYLLARSLAVVDIEYRLLPHANLNDMNQDVLAAYGWIRTDLNGLLAEDTGETVIDGSSVGATGDSAGGYLSLMLGVTAQPPLRAVAPFYGMSDLSTLASGSKDDIRLGFTKAELSYIDQAYTDGSLTSAHPEWSHPGPRLEWRKAAMASESLISHLVPEDSIENRKRLSALYLAAVTYPPTFLAIPQFDEAVAPTQSWRFAEKLRSLGVEVETGRADGGGHCFDRQGGVLNQEGGQWWEDVTRPALDFLVRHLTVER